MDLRVKRETGFSPTKCAFGVRMNLTTYLAMHLKSNYKKLKETLYFVTNEFLLNSATVLFQKHYQATSDS
jgi:hypothetical protein